MTHIHSFRGQLAPAFSATFCPFGCFSFFQLNMQRKGTREHASLGNTTVRGLTYSQLIVASRLFSDDHNVVLLVSGPDFNSTFLHEIRSPMLYIQMKHALGYLRSL